MYISKEQWIRLFAGKPNSNELRVRKGNGTVLPLSDYKQLSHSQIQLFKDIISNKYDFLSKFYENSLMPPTTHMNDIEIVNPSVFSNVENIKYKNIVRNIYYKEILKETTTDIKNVPNFYNVIHDLFTQGIIDYKLVTPSVLAEIERGKLSSKLTGLYFRASIMNPWVVYKISNSALITGSSSLGKVFTPTLGWSSYSIGFCNNHHLKEYVGIDVIPKVCSNTQKIVKLLRPDVLVDIYCRPSETFIRDPNFLAKYNRHFDFIFFSPPYYRLELYPGKTQSTSVYETFDEWLTGYWKPTIQLCSRVLKKGSRMAYVISGYGKTDDADNMTELMNLITRNCGFLLIHKTPLVNNNVSFTTHRDTGEVIFVWKLL